jgi:hypothetical protein
LIRRERAGVAVGAFVAASLPAVVTSAAATDSQQQAELLLLPLLVPFAVLVFWHKRRRGEI